MLSSCKWSVRIDQELSLNENALLYMPILYGVSCNMLLIILCALQLTVSSNGEDSIKDLKAKELWREGVMTLKTNLHYSWVEKREPQDRVTGCHANSTDGRSG